MKPRIIDRWTEYISLEQCVDSLLTIMSLINGILIDGHNKLWMKMKTRSQGQMKTILGSQDYITNV